MSQIKQITVPDIGDFSNVPVIEIMVKPGDTIAIDDSICTLESDKATMDVPADTAGVVTEVLIKEGDRVSFGSPLITMQIAEDNTKIKAATVPAPAAASAAAVPSAVADSGSAADITCDMLVVGGGPGGYSAAFRAADLGLNTVIVERYPTLGGVCLNVGCIPSKALLHVTTVMDEVKHFSDYGITFAPPRVSLDQLRTHKETVVSKLTGGLAGMAKGRKVTVVRGIGQFTSPTTLAVSQTEGRGRQTTGKQQIIRFKQCIIAAGSQAVKLPFMPDDPRVIDSTGALALQDIPAKMLIVGGGIIGLEMATVYSALGSEIDIVEMQDGLMQGADRDLVRIWEKKNLHRFAQVMLKTRTVSAEARKDGIWVKFDAAAEGINVPAEAQRYDRVLVAVGRRPNGNEIGADKAGIIVQPNGFIPVDNQMRTNISHIFAIGDIVGQPMLAHKAVHEGHVAAEVAAGQKSSFDALQIPSVAYTDPEVAWAGLTEEQAKAQKIKYDKALFPWAASGRAIANGRDEGMTKLLFDSETHRLIGGAIAGTHAGDLIGEVCLAIEMGADATDIGKTIHPHPTLCESVGMAAEVAHGSCTDLPAQRKK